MTAFVEITAQIELSGELEGVVFFFQNKLCKNLTDKSLSKTSVSYPRGMSCPDPVSEERGIRITWSGYRLQLGKVWSEEGISQAMVSSRGVGECTLTRWPYPIPQLGLV